jgi:hypothetical protein
MILSGATRVAFHQSTPAQRADVARVFFVSAINWWWGRFDKADR